MHVLDRGAVQRLRGLAILAIVLHNFFHLIFRKTKENEMNFDPARFQYFLTDFIDAPTEWIPAVFTYFGHFGVQIFIFLSAYCLSLSYSSVRLDTGFLASRIKKLYPTFVIVILIWVAISGYGEWGGSVGPLQTLVDHFRDIVLLLAGLYPLVPGNFYPMVGPWWFIPYIMQFYVLWAVIGSWACNTSGRTLLALIIVGLAVNKILVPLIKVNIGVNLLFTPLGHLPEIFLGVYFARYGVASSWLVLVPASVGLVLSGMSWKLWPMHHLTALVVFLVIGLRIVASRHKYLRTGLLWLGTYSLPIFLVNGPLREPFVAFAKAKPIWWLEIVLAVMFSLAACLVAFLVSRIASAVENRLASPAD